MAYAPHAMIAFVGKWNVTAAADEVWQFGIRVTSGTPDGGHISDCQAFADAIATDVGTWFGAGTSQMQNNALLTAIKVNNILPNGKYADGDTHQHVFATPPAGGASGLAPGKTSVCVSFKTDLGRGRAGHGRIYPPNMGTGLADPFEITEASRDNIANSAKALLTILLRDDSAGHHIAPCIASKLDGSVGIIQTVVVDTVLDVQKRRGNRVVGTRKTLAFP